MPGRMTNYDVTKSRESTYTYKLTRDQADQFQGIDPLI